jgi:hypothetical protein
MEGGGDGGGAKSCEKAWSSSNQSILSGVVQLIESKTGDLYTIYLLRWLFYVFSLKKLDPL